MGRAEEGTGAAARVSSGTESWPIQAVHATHGEAGLSKRNLPEAGELLGGRFFLRRLLGAGATGLVFEALDHVSGQTVAVKVLHPGTAAGNGLERLRREVRLSRPGHPNVVRLNDLHQLDGHLLLSMELVEGRSLQARLAGEEPFAVPDVIALGREVAAALAYLHGNGLVHRDVKPGNILLAADGSVRLCDLGLLRPLEHGLTVTMTDVVVGTPAYMAPEQASGRELTGAADVYALGLTLWQALTGKVPITGSSAVETMTRRQREEPPRLRPLRPDCPRWLERLLRGMLAPRPEDRPAVPAVVTALSAGRFRPLPRARTLGAAAVAIFVALGLAFGARELVVRRTVRFEKAGNAVHGVDTKGRTTWSRSFESPVRQMLEMDLDADGRKELVVAAWGADGPVTRIDALPPSEVVLLRTDGTVVTRVRPEDAVGAWSHPFPKRFQPRAIALDVDHDGTAELVVLCPHWAFYPTEVLLYWPKARTWDHVLDHWGRVYDVAAVPGTRARLRFLARNNALGMACVLGELELVGPQARGTRRPDGPMLQATPGIGSGSPLASWVAYTLFETGTPTSLKPVSDHLRVLSNGGTVVPLAGREVVFDARGNPAAGPNAGSDLAGLRLEFATDDSSARWSSRVERERESIAREMASLGARFEPLLREPQYRLAFDLLFARRLACSRAPGEAAVLLRGTVAGVPGEEARYQLAGFLALGGDLESSARLLRELAQQPADLRGVFDGPQLLLRVGAERRSDTDVSIAVDALSLASGLPVGQPGLAAALRARANLVRDRVSDADAAVRSWSFAPEGEATAVLARWRLGRNLPTDEADMERFRAAATDAEVDGGLALAAARLAGGQAAEAASLCGEIGRTIEPEARTSFERSQQLSLAQALRAKALLAAGDVGGARATARTVLAASRPGLLWSNLANEVLSAAGRDEGVKR